MLEPIRSWLYSVLGLLGFVVAAYLLLTYGLPLLFPFVLALIIAELVEPLVGLITWRNKVPRSLAVTLVLLLFVGVITLGVTAAMARLVHEVELVIERLPWLYAVGQDLAGRFAEQFGAFHATLPGNVQQLLAANLGKVESFVTAELTNMAGQLSALASLPALFTNLLIALVATFFISRDRAVIGEFLLRLFPAVWRPQVRRVKERVWTSAMGWAKAQFILIALTTVQCMIGLAAIGANYALLMGMVIGIFDVMPLLGPAAVFLPWIAYSFLFGSKVFGVKLLVLYAIVAGVRQVLEAKVVGDQLGLHPLAILLSIYLGFLFFGALGFVYGPLLAIVLKALIESGLLPIFQE